MRQCESSAEMTQCEAKRGLSLRDLALTVCVQQSNAAHGLSIGGRDTGENVNVYGTGAFQI